MFNLIQNNGRSIQHRFLQRYIFCFSKKKKKKNTKFKMKFIESRYPFGKENNSRLPIFPKYRFHGKDRIV